MKYYTPIKIASDLSERAFESAWEQAFKPDYCYLIVSPWDVGVARKLLNTYPQLKGIEVKLNFDPDMWALSYPYGGVFSEGA